MYSRLLSLAISLLPHSARQSMDNPVQWHRLPNHSGVELDYPVFQDTPQIARRKTAIFLMLASLIGPIMWLDGLFYSTFHFKVPFFDGGLKIIVLLVAVSFLLIGEFGHRWPLRTIAAAIFLIPFFTEWLTVTSYASVALFPTIFAIYLMSENLAMFFLYLKTAAPLSINQSRRARSAFQFRWFSLRHPMPGAELYILNLLGPLFPLAIMIGQENRIRQGWDTLNTTAIFVMVILFGFFWPHCLEIIIAPIYRRRSFTKRQMVQSFSRALVEWYTYNRLNTRGVGVHQSPAGTCRIRRILLTGGIFSWACLWIGSQTVSIRVSDPTLDHKALVEQQLSPIVNAMLMSRPPDDHKFDPSWAEVFTSPDEKYDLPHSPPNKVVESREERSRHNLQQGRVAAQNTSDGHAGRASARLFKNVFVQTAALILSVLVPTLGTLLSFLAIVFATTARFITGVEEQFSNKTRNRVLSTDNWEFLAERVRTSRDELEFESIFMGTNARDDTPVLIPRGIFREHAHILGDSGSGKTSLGILPLVCQLMRRGDTSIIVIDLKADDQVLFETLRVEAENIPRRNLDIYSADDVYPCRWFTSALDRSSYLFNPLTQRVMSMLPENQQADLITAALGLQYGTDYGRKFYGDANFDLLQYTLEQNPNIQNLTELSEFLDTSKFPGLSKETIKNASNVITAIRRLARVQALNGSPSQRTSQTVLDDAIDFSDVFDVPQVIYFGLPPASGISTTADIARFAMYSLLEAAQLHPEKKEKTQVYLVIDEFQRIVANNLAVFLQTARSMGIGVILSNQSLSDLELPGINLIPAVRTNTRYRQVYGVGSRDDIREIRDTAGETLVGMRSWQILPHFFNPPTVESMGVRETPVSRLGINDILLATDVFGRCITTVRRGDGYAQFGGMSFIMDSVHHISKDGTNGYDDLRTRPWPDPNEGCRVATLTSKEKDPIKGVGGVLTDPPETDPRSTDDGVAPSGERKPDIQAELREKIKKLNLEEEEKKAQRKRKKTSSQDIPSETIAGDVLSSPDDASASSTNDDLSIEEEPNVDEEDEEEDDLATMMDQQIEEEERQRRENAERKRKKKRDEEDDREFPLSGAVL